MYFCSHFCVHLDAKRDFWRHELAFLSLGKSFCVVDNVQGASELPAMSKVCYVVKQSLRRCMH